MSHVLSGPRGRVALAAAILAVMATSASVDAWAVRVNQIPNGAALSCSACHVNPGGGGERNAFGQQIEANFLTGLGFTGSVIWGPELAALDADGDGASNGAELGDPEGLWRAGDPDPGDAEAVTEPWNADSFPPPAPTAVQASSWAEVKAAAAAQPE